MLRLKRTPKRVAVFALLAAAATLASAVGARAANVTLGLAASDPAATCEDLLVLNTATRPGGPSYVVPPGAWKISSFSIAGGTNGGTGSLVVLRSTGNPSEYAVVYSSSVKTLTAGVTGTFPASASVKGGDIIALWMGEGECGLFTGDSEDVVAGEFVSSPPLAGTTVTAPLGVTGFTINIAALLTPASSATPLPPPPPRIGVCTKTPVARLDGTTGVFADILLSQYGTKDESSPYFGAVPAIFVQGYGLVCQISDIVTYGDDPSRFEDSGLKVDGTGMQPPSGLEGVWSAPYEYWVRSTP